MTRGVFQPFTGRKKPGKKNPSGAASSLALGNTPRQASCSTCFDLDFKFVPLTHTNANTPSPGLAAKHWISSLDLTWNINCKSCNFLKSAFDTLIASWDLPGARRDMPYKIAIIDRDDPGAIDMPASMKSQGFETARSLMVVLRCSPDGAREDDYEEEFQVEIYTPPGAPLPPQIGWRAIGAAGEVPTNPSAEEYATTAKPWIDNCDHNHRFCRRVGASENGEDTLPRRVLDLSDGRIRLVETIAGQQGRYVALSHCWGKEQLLTTTRDTFASRVDGIELHDMPRTFQDSIQITRSLGIRYIWIDSLCIIQNDKQDWEEQSALMADIYARCYLNIAATRAAGGHEGVIRPRQTRRDTIEWARVLATRKDASYDTRKLTPRFREFEVKSFKIPGEQQSDARIRLALWSSHEALQTSRQIRLHKEVAPLLPRTWVYQERSLSFRTLHLHSSEAVWICNEMQRCECAAFNANPMPGDELSELSTTKAQIAKLAQTRDMSAMHGLWRTVVEDVSILDLTFESDRLPALSGLASKFSEHFPDNERYLAGLWEGDLLRDLLWKSTGRQQTGDPTRVRIPGAPSWSWASLAWGGDHQSGIDWEYETKQNLERWMGTVMYRQDPRAKIIRASVDIQGKNKYGVVSGGSIIVEGAICGVIMGDKDIQELPPLPISNVLILRIKDVLNIHLNFDTADSKEKSLASIVCLLFIGHFIENSDDPDEAEFQPCGLILTPTSVEGKFERIGRWTQYMQWFYKQDIWTKMAGIHQVEII